MRSNSVNNSVNKTPYKGRITRALDWNGIAYQGSEYLQSGDGLRTLDVVSGFDSGRIES